MSEVAEVDLKVLLEELRQKVESFAAEHEEFRTVHISRRGLTGGRGEAGPIGPQGIPGRDADPAKVVEIAQQTMRTELETAKAVLSQIVVDELKRSGVIDEFGNAVLIPGPSGAPGADSTVPGPKGDLGPAGRDGRDGFDGKDGKDGRDGERGPAGPQGERGEYGEPGVSNVPGPRGEVGPEGPQGIPGTGLNKHEVVQIIIDMAKRGSIPGIGLHAPHQGGIDLEAHTTTVVRKVLEEQKRAPEERRAKGFWSWFRK